jgi:hypothetical protein
MLVQNPANRTPNAIQIISEHLGDRKHEDLNPGLTYMAISRATTIGCLVHMATISKKCMNSAIYFLGGTFPSGIKCLTHAYSKKEDYIKLNRRSAWVAYLEKKKKKQNSLWTPVPKVK